MVTFVQYATVCCTKCNQILMWPKVVTISAQYFSRLFFFQYKFFETNIWSHVDVGHIFSIKMWPNCGRIYLWPKNGHIFVGHIWACCLVVPWNLSSNGNRQPVRVGTKSTTTSNFLDQEKEVWERIPCIHKKKKMIVNNSLDPFFVIEEGNKSN